MEAFEIRNSELFHGMKSLLSPTLIPIQIQTVQDPAQIQIHHLAPTQTQLATHPILVPQDESADEPGEVVAVAAVLTEIVVAVVLARLQ